MDVSVVSLANVGETTDFRRSQPGQRDVSLAMPLTGAVKVEANL
jgi:hypothetical protein